MSLLHFDYDPCKLSLKEVENIIFVYHLENALHSLLEELQRVNYDGYIKLSKPKDYYSREDWENILVTLQENILQAKVQTESNPLPIFLEKMLQRILRQDDFTGFSNFVERFAEYLPEELVRVRDNLAFMKWIYYHLQNKTLILDQSSLRLSPQASPDDIDF